MKVKVKKIDKIPAKEYIEMLKEIIKLQEITIHSLEKKCNQLEVCSEIVLQ